MNYFAHPTAVIDDNTNIGDDTKIEIIRSTGVQGLVKAPETKK